jgi:DNA-binding Lrp family transcriptional regulator
MDRIDRQIVHCVQRDGRASFRRIAEVVEVSEQTVARRYRALVDSGAVRVVVLPQAAATGHQKWYVRIHCRPGSSETLAEAVAAREDVTWVSITAGGSELVCDVRHDPESAGGSLLDRLPRTSQVLEFGAHTALHLHVGGESEWLGFGDPLSEEQVTMLLGAERPRHGVTVTGTIRPDDAPLLAALGRDGRAGVVELARVTGWPQSRVSGRLDELLSTGAVYPEVDLSAPRFGFHASAYLWLTLAPGDLDETGHALSLHRETSFAAAITGVANLLAVVTCRDTDDLYRFVTTKVGALPAVQRAEVVPVLRRVKQAGTLVRQGRLVLA